nr:hypothetical protein [Morchella crassipes]
MIKMTPPSPFLPPPSLHVMRGVEGVGKRPFNYFNGRFPPPFPPFPPLHPPPHHCVVGGGRGAVKIAKPLSNFHNNPSSPSISPPLSWPLGPRERRSGAPHPPPPSNSSSWTGGCEGGPGKGWLGKPLPPLAKTRRGGEMESGGRWREGGCIPPLPHSPPPPPIHSSSIEDRLDWGGEVQTLPLFTTWGSPPEHKAKGGDPQVWKEGGEREEGTVNAPLVFKNFHF